MIICNLKLSHLLYFTVFIIIIHTFVCEESGHKNLDVINSANASNTKSDSLPSLNKEDVANGLNVTIITTNKTSDVGKISVKEDDKKEKTAPEIVEPHKSAKVPVTVPSVVNPPQAKVDKPAAAQVRDPHAGRIVLLFLGVLFVLYVIVHNKNRIMGMIVEGRGGRVNGRRGANVRYRRLNNAEDAVVEAGIQ